MSNDIFHLTVVNKVEDFIDLKPAWNKIIDLQTTATPFQCWHWNYGFISNQDKNLKLNVLVLKNAQNEILGIAPLQLRKIKRTNLYILEFIGGRKSDYQDLLYLDGYKIIFIQKIFEHIRKNKNWFLLNFTCLNFDTANSFHQISKWDIQKYEVCPVAELPCLPNDFDDKISKILKSSVKRKLKQLQKSGNYSFEIAKTGNEFEYYFDELVYLHQKRQNEKGELGKFANENFKNSFKEISRNLFDENILRFGILKIDGNPAAVHLNLRLHNKEYTYMGGINSGFNDYRPGNILDYLMITTAIEEGVKVYDFLQGAEKYKQDWTNSTNQLYQINASRYEVVLSIWNGFLEFRENIYRNETIRKFYNAAVKFYQGKKNPKQNLNEKTPANNIFELQK